MHWKGMVYVMSNTAKQIADFSIWDSVVNDRIVQFEDLERKYRDRCKTVETLVEENEKLKAGIDEASEKVNFVCGELNEKEARIQVLAQEVVDLKQWIANMEDSVCWKITKPIRMLLDKVKSRK